MALSAQHRRFLIADQGVGATVFNFVLNGLIAWVLFRSAESVPLWGPSSVAGDTIATAFILPFATCLIVSRIVARQVSTGRLARLSDPTTAPLVTWLAARTPLRRGAALGLAAVVIAAVPAILWLSIGGPNELARGAFVWFKASFAAGLAAVVTPLIAWVALVTSSRGS